MKKRPDFKNRGAALAIVILSLVILLIMGASLLSMGWQSRIMTIRNTAGIGARTATDAGLEVALYEMNQKLNAGPWSDSALPAGAAALPNSNGSYEYSVSGDMASGLTVVSTGRDGLALAKVTATTKIEGMFEYALYVKESMDLKHGTVIDGYNYGSDDRPLEIATGSTEASSILMKSGVTIDGDVLVGFGSDPDEVIETLRDNTITGDAASLAHLWEPPIIPVPDTLAASVSQGNLDTGTTLTSSGKFDGLHLSNGDILTIDGPVELFITGEVILDNFAQIQIIETNPNASLTLYVAGNYEEKNGGAVNNLAQDAQKMTLYGLETCQHIDLRTASIFYRTIYAPNADVVLHNSVEMYGAVVANSFTQMVNAGFHYAAALRTLAPSEVGVRFVLNRRSEE